MNMLDVKGVEPKTALPGGLVRVLVQGCDASAGDVSVFFDSHAAQILGVSSQSILVRVPTLEGKCSVRVRQKQVTGSSGALFVGVPIASEVNAVANPALDRAGNIYVAFSGPRGASVPFSVYRILAGSGDKEPFLADIMNATGIAIGPDDSIYVSSRHTGTVYRSDPQKNLTKFAENLGIPTGLALDTQGNLYVGDRAGPIHRISPDGKGEVICEIEPSVSAFHLALGRSGTLFVSGPTLATQDNIYEIGPDRAPKIFFRGIGRPQGMSFDKSGRLLVAGSYRGKRGVFAIDRQRRIEQLVSSPILVGVVATPSGDLILADSTNLYLVPAGDW